MSTAGTPLPFKGYLLKHNREARRSNILPGAKYKRRWVEVTSNTMVYAASQQDALTGHIQVFSISELVWVKLEADTKFQVKFPERTLKFKVPSGFKEERDRWVEAFHAAKKQNVAAQHALTSGAGKLEALQKTLLGPGSSSSAGGAAAARHYSETGSIMLSSAGTSIDGSSVAGSSIAGSTRTSNIQEPFLTGSTNGANGANQDAAGMYGQRPPSPRSLLANARLGMALVGSMSGSPAGTPRNTHTPPSAAARPASATYSVQPLKQQQQQPARELLTPRHAGSDSDGEGGSFQGSSAAGTDDSDSDDATEHTAAARVHTPRDAAAGAVGAVVIPALQLPGDSPQAASSEGSAQATPSGRKAHLARRVTPGVLLTSRPTTPATSTGQQQQQHQQFSQPLTPSRQQPSTVPASPLAANSLTAAVTALQQQCGVVDDDDEELVLDEPGSHTAPPGAKTTQCHLRTALTTPQCQC